MISVSEAKKHIAGNTHLLPAVALPLAKAAGMVLAEGIISDLDVPPFDQSAMDGYAIRFDDLAVGQPLRVIGVVPAGAPPAQGPEAGEAMRIFTGAPVPSGADTVVMQEKVIVDGKQIRIEDSQLQRGDNVRPRASQTRKGDIALSAGAVLTPGAIGFLAGLGVETVHVWAKPRICLLITGTELAPPGSPLQPGQVYESNSFALTAALREMHIEPTLVFRSNDDENQITAFLKTAIQSCDMLIATGGISVGDHDLVKKAMENCAVETVFYKVKQKPGKPLYLGKKDKVLLFGLPGNPASVLTCFYEYVVPAIQNMTGKTVPTPGRLTKVLAEDFAKKEGLTYFLKGKLDGDLVVPLHAQESYRMNSFADADCLIVLEENKTRYRKGEIVEVHLLPGT